MYGKRLETERPEYIEISWEDWQPGWEWRAYYRDEHGLLVEEGGGFEGRKSLKKSTLRRRARAAAGWAGSRVPVWFHTPGGPLGDFEEL